MSIRWIRQAFINGQATSLEILLGQSKISDKCYVRIGTEPERWFMPRGDERESILQEGKDLLISILKDKTLLSSNGSPFIWDG